MATIVRCRARSRAWSGWLVRSTEQSQEVKLSSIRTLSAPTSREATRRTHHGTLRGMDIETAEIEVRGEVFKPNVVLSIGEKRSVKGAAKDPYVQKRREEGFYSCTCPTWRNLVDPERQRTCQHLKALLGKEYEEARMKKERSESPVTAPKGKGKGIKGQKKKADELDEDTFPMSTSQPKKAKNLYKDFNERANYGPRDLNGGSELLLAMKWPDGKDPTGYWLSEKLDGVRAWWDGSKMWSRSGRAWNPPQWFMDRLPKDLHLDGELWMKRDAFDETSGICRRSDPEGWKRINFMVFDITNISLLYEDRLKELKGRLVDGEMTPAEIDYHRLGGKVCVLPAVQCRGQEHLDTLMGHIMDKGGEGLMLRQPKSAYEYRRSKTLYKLKYWYDAEGLVVGHEWGQGEHKGRMGAVRIEMESGKTITVGSGFSIAQRDSWQPPRGSVIRYRFQELSHDGFPRFPIYEGTTADKTKAKDAIVRSTKYRADAKKEDLQRALDDFGRGGEVEASASSSRTAST